MCNSSGRVMMPLPLALKCAEPKSVLSRWRVLGLFTPILKCTPARDDRQPPLRIGLGDVEHPLLVARRGLGRREREAHALPPRVGGFSLPKALAFKLYPKKINFIQKRKCGPRENQASVPDTKRAHHGHKRREHTQHIRKGALATCAPSTLCAAHPASRMSSHACARLSDSSTGRAPSRAQHMSVPRA